MKFFAVRKMEEILAEQFRRPRLSPVYYDSSATPTIPGFDSYMPSCVTDGADKVAGK